MKTPIRLITLLIVCTATSVYAQNKPQFAFPLDCDLGTDCWTVNYVDVDSHPKSARDYTCSHKTDEGHKGTDFAIRSRVEMEKGVDVLAARDGTVLRMRNGEDDLPKTEEQNAEIRKQNKDCGNGIVLDHGNSLLSYFCHLNQDSIKVAVGDEVTIGQPIAQVGQSGFAEFPHLHFTVIWEGGQMDPFTANLKDDGCGKYEDNLWEDDLPYEPYTIFNGGFTQSVPDFKAIEKGQEPIKTLSANGEAFVYWAAFFHAFKGDKITLTILDPNGNIWAQREHILEKSRKRPSYYYTGRKLQGRTLQTGTYTGTIEYEKNGYPPKIVTHTVEVK